MSLSQGLSKARRELRKWDLAPIGAVLVVVLLAAGLFLALTSSGGRSNQDKVRAFFMSSEGGSATNADARRIEVSTCQPTGETVRSALVISCAVSHGAQTFRACYVWQGDKLIAGGNRPIGNCLPVLWDRRSRSLLGLREDQ